MNKQALFCSQCGNQLKTGAKFCPKCVAAIAPTQQVTNQNQSISQNDDVAENIGDTTVSKILTTDTVQHVRKYSGNYFSWFKMTMRHPGRTIDPTNRYFGLTSVGLEALLLALSIASILRKAENVANDFTNSLTGSTNNAIHAGSFILKTSVLVFLIVLGVYAVYIGIAYAFRRVVNTDSMQLHDFINQFAAITNLILVFNVITLLLTILTGTSNFSGMTGLFFFMIPTIGIMNLAFIYIIINNVVKPHIDKFYALIIAEIALGFSLTIYVMILAVLGGNMIFSQLSSLFS
ncbi:zinc ribbon domain-containing protein [Lactiplantibacillus pentosus]|uniref:zinc ribbon domain-containing protein n=1 Tax=Lactiplantibacillus pentosus TaxID=1589 RepID=UPI001C1FC057|nr:zinc ribbon domain-containing protein [Lactiplantibacillus pentosus]MBU7498310.1 zinc ribbon domain-containing protein [Lactiplantibacillus pentosus]WNN84505.1 zinc ribbon domain-containing protein [Lactiplantibacillus pentosus]